MREVTWPWTRRCSVIWSTRTAYGSPRLRVPRIDAVSVGGDLSALDGGNWQHDLPCSRMYTIAGGCDAILRDMIAERALNIPKERVK
jgi:hypothetical protein